MRKIIQWIMDAWIMAGIVILMLIGLNAGAALMYFYADQARPGGLNEGGADTYHQASWPKAYFKEFDQLQVRWTPYVYWRKNPYKGRYINIDRNGLRQTVSLMNAGSSRPLRIFMFGGSAIWGTGARDAFTIPSLVQHHLAKEGIAVQVINFGEGGYVNTQELITLMLQLQKGNVPDMVIFYDGTNDVFSAYQNGMAGMPQNEIHRVLEFGLWRRNPLGLGRLALQKTWEDSSLKRLINVFVKHRGQKFEASRNAYALGLQVKNVYEHNLMIIESLASAYKFSCLFYWQPTVFEKMYLSPYEKSEMYKALYLEPFLKQTRALLDQDQAALDQRYQFHDLSGSFSKVQQPLFIDWQHTGEDGNGIIALRMLQDIVPLIHNR